MPLAKGNGKKEVRAMLLEEKKRLEPIEFRKHAMRVVRDGRHDGEVVFWAAIEDEFCPPIGWLESWERGGWGAPWFAIDYLRRLPAAGKKLALRFPPSCIVRAKVAVPCPSPGHVALVTGYRPPKEFPPEGLIRVRSYPGAFVTYEHKPDILEVVGYYQGLTEECVATLIE